jgi:hypothetical protein
MEYRSHLLLPEHKSNANHVWTTAFFLSQMNNIESSINEQQSNPHYNHHNQHNHHQNGHLLHKAATFIENTQTTTTTTTNQDDSLKPTLLPHAQTQLQLKNHENSPNNDLISTDYNERMLRILKIKQRNKASLYNLIIASLNKNKKKIHSSDTFSYINDDDESSKPWLNMNSTIQNANNEITCSNWINEGCKR